MKERYRLNHRDDMRGKRKGDTISRVQFKKYFRGQMCGVRRPGQQGILCTREKGHSGRHMATVCHTLVVEPWKDHCSPKEAEVREAEGAIA